MAQENDTNYNNDSQEHILELVLPFLPVRDVFHVTLVSRHFASNNNDLTIGRLKYERTIRIFPKVDLVPATVGLLLRLLPPKFVQVPPKFVFPSGNVFQDPRDEPIMFDSWSNSKKANSIAAYWTLFETFYDSVPKPPVDDWQVDDDDDDGDAFVEAVWHHYARELAISQAPLRLMNDFHPQASSFVPWNLSEIDNAEKSRDPVVIVIYCMCHLCLMNCDFALIPDDLDHREATHYRPWLVAAVTILLVFSLVILQQGEFSLPIAEL